MRQATTDWNAADRAPEYTGAAGAKVSTDMHPAVESRTEAAGALYSVVDSWTLGR